MDWSELLHWNEYVKLTIGLFAISTPLAAIPVFLGMTGSFSTQERKRIALVAAITYASTLLVFAYAGVLILNTFGITIAAFKVAGGILLLLGALDMMRSEASPSSTESSPPANPLSIGIVPLAIPILAGPGAISTIIVYAHYHESLAHNILLSIVIIIMAISIYFLFRIALGMGPMLGHTTNVVLSKVMGLIIASIAVEFVLDGLVEHFPNLISIHDIH